MYFANFHGSSPFANLKFFSALLLALPIVDAGPHGIERYHVPYTAYFSKKDSKPATQKNCASKCKNDYQCKSYAVVSKYLQAISCQSVCLGTPNLMCV